MKGGTTSAFPEQSSGISFGRLRASAAKPIHVGFLLTESFTLLAFSSALETLRLTNDLARASIFTWAFYSGDGEGVRSSSGVEIGVTGPLTSQSPCDLLIVCSGHDLDKSGPASAEGVLRFKVRHGTPVISICTGALLLARAGVLTAGACTVHWDYEHLLAEKFPDLKVTNTLYVANSPGLVTCGGGVAAIDLLLELVRSVVGDHTAAKVAEKMLYRHGRRGDSPQRFAVSALANDRDPRVMRAIEIMKENIRDPVRIRDIAGRCRISSRQLERRFTALMGVTPRKYYLELRLEMASSMLLDTNLSWKDIAASLSFRSAQSLRNRLGASSKHR